MDIVNVRFKIVWAQNDLFSCKKYTGPSLLIYKSPFEEVAKGHEITF